MGKWRNLIIIPGPASVDLGLRVAGHLNSRAVSVEFKRFPDGESYIRFTESIENEDVIIVQTTSPPQNENLVQLLLMADNAMNLGAKSITAVMPYFAYARQDRRFRPGEALSVRTIITALKACGVNGIITINAHNPSFLKGLDIPIRDLSAIPLLAEHFGSQGIENALSISLGKKGMTAASEADDVLRGGRDYIPTHRDVITGNVTLEEKQLPVKDRDVIIFDDIISSGGTMIKAIRTVKDQGARRVFIGVVHLLLIGDAVNRILGSGVDGMVGTDCMPNPFSIVSIAPLVAQTLRKT